MPTSWDGIGVDRYANPARVIDDMQVPPASAGDSHLSISGALTASLPMHRSSVWIVTHVRATLLVVAAIEIALAGLMTGSVPTDVAVIAVIIALAGAIVWYWCIRRGSLLRSVDRRGVRSRSRIDRRIRACVHSTLQVGASEHRKQADGEALHVTSPIR